MLIHVELLQLNTEIIFHNLQLYTNPNIRHNEYDCKPSFCPYLPRGVLSYPILSHPIPFSVHTLSLSLALSLSLSLLGNIRNFNTIEMLGHVYYKLVSWGTGIKSEKIQTGRQLNQIYKYQYIRGNSQEQFSERDNDCYSYMCSYHHSTIFNVLDFIAGIYFQVMFFIHQSYNLLLAIEKPWVQLWLVYRKLCSSVVLGYPHSLKVNTNIHVSKSIVTWRVLSCEYAHLTLCLVAALAFPFMS